ncbi:T9SS type A sorting domain-containing protein [Flavobacterium aciduliphilum]|uniref:Putative secreted protein (Por secretion system target) n=1 Tax=Flavobacterium aciduliphilum TaxID=1101402 RepID=A0A328YKT7_9FLAO|nr:T9SS type A sorting domain-containing protein [Flavobacterium aciduliphilum]RAR74150.1 putative secreted protein (Por secretion system target) [Flavobacterium aciduliphilum]
MRNDEFFASNFSVTPNPASDVITIATKNNIPVESVQVLDMNGRVIKEMNATFEDATTMNISEINSGVYFVKVKSQIVVGTTKVVKK